MDKPTLYSEAHRIALACLNCDYDDWAGRGRILDDVDAVAEEFEATPEYVMLCVQNAYAQFDPQLVLNETL